MPRPKVQVLPTNVTLVIPPPPGLMPRPKVQVLPTNVTLVIPPPP